MQVSSDTSDASRWRLSSRLLVQAAAVAWLAGDSLGAVALAAEAQAAASGSTSRADQELDTVTVTGSRITRRDTETTSPLITVEKEVLEKSSYISIEQALNELPEFMAGGALFGAGAVTGLTAAGDVAGGAGTGNMFDTARPVDNARAGQYTPGAATANLRGLGPNRSLTLIDGRRGVPSNASGAIDLNTVPQIGIANIEVITGGASAVYGADALAGVTNIKLRNNFNGVEVRTRGGINQAGGDGKEWQFSTIIGTDLGGNRGHAMVAMDYSKREMALWKNRSYFRDVMKSQLSNAGDYIFAWYPAYAPGTSPAASCTMLSCTTTSLAATAGGGSNNVFNAAWAGNGPLQSAINTVFADRTCGAAINCVTNTSQGNYFFNADGTLWTSTSNATIGGVINRYGPQGFNGPLGGTRENPDELVCNYTAGFNNVLPQFQKACNPTISRVDYGRRLTSPRDGYTLLGTSDFAINDHVTAYSALTFAYSNTETRREPSPASGNWGIAIPYHSNPSTIYLPSVVQNTSGGLPIGSTLPEFRAGGSRGTNCGPTGGCTMAQAFPVSAELRQLLANRPDVTLNNTGSPFNGMSVCEQRSLDLNATAGRPAQRTTAGGVGYTVQMDPNTGDTAKICGPNSPWRLATQMGYLPPRGTFNTQTDYQLFVGAKGDTFVSDWTWDWYLSEGEARTLTEYKGYVSAANYAAIIAAPNYGQGYTIRSSVSNKTFTCTSGLDPFKQAAGTLAVTQDCIDAVTSNQADKQSMQQYESQLNLQGGLFELPAGQVRSAVGFSWRKNNYMFKPDSLREPEAAFDGPMGQFGVAVIDGTITAREAYGELLVPLLKGMPGARSLDLELGYRYSDYSSGQTVPTYKIQMSWEPLSWLRFRGGYNRAERTPNIAERDTLPTTSSQLSTGLDPCSSNNGVTLPNSNSTLNTNAAQLAQLRALCSEQINFWGGNNASTYHQAPTTFISAPQVVTFRGNPDLKSEQGDTWTAGVVLGSPFSHVLLQRLSSTIDWYQIKIKDTIDVLSSQFILNACFNQDSLNPTNPTYALNDPGGYCALIERDPVSGGARATRTRYENLGENSVAGVDVAVRWSAGLADMGLAALPGTFSVNVGANFLMEQNQPIAVGGVLQDYAGYVGASKLRGNTSVAYSVGRSRVSLSWLYHRGTKGLGGDNRPTTLFAGYPTGNQFNLSAGTSVGLLDVSANVSNLLDTHPGPAGYAFADATNGYGTFDPYRDLVGRRYSINLTAKF